MRLVAHMCWRMDCRDGLWQCSKIQEDAFSCFFCSSMPLFILIFFNKHSAHSYQMAPRSHEVGR